MAASYRCTQPERYCSLLPRIWLILLKLPRTTGTTRRKERAPVDTSWISLDVVHTILRRVSSSERERNSTRKEEAQTSKYGMQIEAAKNMSHKLWSLPENWQQQGSFNKDGCVVSQPKGKNARKNKKMTNLNQIQKKTHQYSTPA